MVTDQLARAMRWSVCCGVLLSCAVPAGVAWADVDQAPPIIRGSGDLWFADGGSVQGDPYDLRVQAEDADQGGAPASGVRSVEVRADGVLLGQRQGGCGAAGCTVDLDVSLDPEQYPEGPLEIEIVAEDATGNRAREAVAVDVVRAPSADPVGGELAAGLTGTGVSGDRAGSSVATIADLNGDGIDEMAVGAASADPRNRIDAGRAYVLDGKAAGDQPLASSGAVLARIDGPAALARAGYALSNPGDVTGDGFDDLLVGVPSAPLVRGQVFVLSGAALDGDIDLADLGDRGFRIDGPQPDLAAALSPARKFGASLSSQPSGGADFNGDGRDDIIVGAPSDLTGLLQPAAAYIVYGRAAGGSPLSVTSLAGQGVRIAAPSGAAGFGASVALVGDMNDDGLAEAVIGAPGSALDTNAAGRAYVLFGRSAAGASIDLSGWTASAGVDGYLVSGRPGDRLGRSVAAAGDVDADGAADVLLGGQVPSLLYGQDSTDPVDLIAADERSATRLQRPPAAVGAAVVAAGADVDDDGVPDLAVAFPGQTGLELVTGASPATVYVLTPSQEQYLPGQLALGELPGELGRRYDAPATAGSAMALRAAGEQTPGQLLLGAPGSFPTGQSGPGRLLATDLTAAGQDPSPEAPPRTAAAVAAAEKKDACRPRNVRYRYDSSADFPSCRRTVKNNKDVNLKIGRKGYQGARLKLKLTGSPAQRRKHGGTGGNGRFVFIKPLKPGKHRLVDSFTKAIVDLEQPSRNNFRLTLPDSTVMGETKNDSGRSASLELLGRGCMNSVKDADKYAFVYLRAGTDPTTGYALEIRGFLLRSALPAGAFEDTTSTNDTVIDSYWLPCGRRGDFTRVRNDPKTYQNPRFELDDQYQSDGQAEKVCDDGGRYLGQFNPNCGVPLLNYNWPQYDAPAPAAPNFPPMVLLQSATTGVNGGGIPRALVNVGSGVALNVRDKIGYADPNVPCGQRFLASWDYVQVGPIWGWWPRNDPSAETRQRPRCPKRPTARITEARPGHAAGIINPRAAGIDNGDENGTQYRFRYQIGAATPVDLPEANAGKGTDDIAVSTDGVLPTCTPTASQVRVTLLARNIAGTATSDTLSYPTPPCQTGILPIARMTQASPSGAAGAINPNGSPTTYVFEYRTLLPDFDDDATYELQQDAGSGTDDVTVTDDPRCLFSNSFGIAYARLRATNAAGTVYSNQLSFFTDCFDV